MLSERFRLYRYLLLASPLAVLPALNFYLTAAEVEGYEPVQGVVIRHHCYAARSPLTLCQSLLQFQGVDGKTYAVWGQGASSLPTPVGRPVDMLRSPHAPAAAVRAGLSGVWGGPAMIALLGWGIFLAVLLGTVIAVRSQRQRLLRLAQRKLERNARASEARRLRREAKALAAQSAGAEAPAS